MLRGNNFSAGTGTIGGVADALNSTEVVLREYAIRQWFVDVVAAEVNVDDPGAGFAVVVTDRS